MRLKPTGKAKKQRKPQRPRHNGTIINGVKDRALRLENQSSTLYVNQIMNTEELVKNFERNNYKVRVFKTGAQAAEYLDGLIDNKIVGFGDSVSLSQIGLYELLSSHNTVYDPSQAGNDNDLFLELAKKCLTTEVFVTSVNAFSFTGEMVNIDGTGNRVAASLFGHEKVIFVIGMNKLEPTLERAITRARSIAAPLNAKRLGLRTPCAVKGKCFDCSSPDRICNAITVYCKKMNDLDSAEIIFVEEELGF